MRIADQPIGHPRLPAPGHLESVRAFINTIDLENGTDEISSPPALGAWLAEHGLIARGRRVTAQDHVLGVELREALRDLLEANTDHPVPSDTGARLDRIAMSVPLRIVFTGQPRLEPEPAGAAPSLGRILANVYDAMADSSWQRLKVCRNDECRWAFYDSSRNRSSSWCSMAVCGNRMKGRAFRQRQRAEGVSAAPA